MSKQSWLPSTPTSSNQFQISNKQQFLSISNQMVKIGGRTMFASRNKSVSYNNSVNNSPDGWKRDVPNMLNC